jgi:hypothetical protein
MNEEAKERRRAQKRKWDRKNWARLSEAEKKARSKYGVDRYNNESHEQRERRRFLERLSWRRRKAGLPKLSPEEREFEVLRWVEQKNLLSDELLRRNSNAIDDLASDIDLGNDIPGRSRTERWTYPRDPKVRVAALRRANGNCEHCGKPGFPTPSGTPYLETHHVIFLAKEGKDKLTNVIALCPNDHREAHFGIRREEIEKEMMLKLKEINRGNLGK